MRLGLIGALQIVIIYVCFTFSGSETIYNPNVRLGPHSYRNILYLRLQVRGNGPPCGVYPHFTGGCCSHQVREMVSR